MQTWYDILQVSPNASKEVIEMAYKALAKQHHPDLNPPEYREQCEENMKILNQARDILTNDESRRQYDSSLYADYYNKGNDECADSECSSTQYYNTPNDISQMEPEYNSFDAKLNKIPVWIRWILFLPAAMVCNYLAAVLFKISYQQMVGTITNDSIPYLLWESTINIGLFLYLCYLFVPKQKFITCTLIGTILFSTNSFTALSLLPVFKELDTVTLLKVIGSVALIITTIWVAIYQFYKNGNEKFEKKNFHVAISVMLIIINLTALVLFLTYYSENESARNALLYTSAIINIAYGFYSYVIYYLSSLKLIKAILIGLFSIIPGTYLMTIPIVYNELKFPSRHT